MAATKTLNIKDPEAYRLASAIASQTGETLTHVVTEALRDRYERLPGRPRKATVAEMLEIGRRAASHMKGTIVDHAELLYDEHGLPK